jgi:hypothetical protein
VTTYEGDAFSALNELHTGEQRFDVVIVDPPAFIKRKKDIRGVSMYSDKPSSLRLEPLLRNRIPMGFNTLTSASTISSRITSIPHVEICTTRVYRLPRRVLRRFSVLTVQRKRWVMSTKMLHLTVLVQR